MRLLKIADSEYINADQITAVKIEDSKRFLKKNLFAFFARPHAKHLKPQMVKYTCERKRKKREKIKSKSQMAKKHKEIH